MLVALAWLGCFPGATRAGSCDAGLLSRLGAHFAIAGLDVPADRADSVLVAQACKVWPYDEAITLATVAYVQSVADVAQGDRMLGRIVAMVSSVDHGFLAGFRDVIAEDAVTALRDDGLWLDTARYDFLPGQRAFGTVFQSSARGPSCPDRGFNDDLTLFVREGSRLRPVFRTYLQTWAAIEGSTCDDSHVSVADSTQTTIGISKSRSHGYADLVIRTPITRFRRDPRAGGLNERAVVRTARRVVRYDGDSYGLDPFRNLFFWLPDEGLTQ